MPKRWSVQLILEDVDAPGIGGGGDVEADDSPYYHEKTYGEGQDHVARRDYRRLKRCVIGCVNAVTES
jgi:hypothetical protein